MVPWDIQNEMIRILLPNILVVCIIKERKLYMIFNKVKICEFYMVMRGGLGEQGSNFPLWYLPNNLLVVILLIKQAHCSYLFCQREWSFSNIGKSYLIKKSTRMKFLMSIYYGNGSKNHFKNLFHQSFPSILISGNLFANHIVICH